MRWSHSRGLERGLKWRRGLRGLMSLMRRWQHWLLSRWWRLLPCGVWWGDGEVSNNLFWFTTAADNGVWCLVIGVCINGCCLWLENDNDWLTLLGNTWGLRQTILVNYISIVREGLGWLLTDQSWWCLLEWGRPGDRRRRYHQDIPTLSLCKHIVFCGPTVMHRMPG